MRLFPLLAVLAALPASAQPWSLEGMLTELVPVVLDAAEDDFATLRGELLSTRGADSLWTSTYRPAGPSGPLYARTAMNRSVDQSVFWFTIAVPDTAFAQRLFGVAMGTLDRQVGGDEGGRGLGWALAIAEDSAVRKAVQWAECAGAGRAVEAVYRPTDTGADVTVSVVRSGGRSCPPGE